MGFLGSFFSSAPDVERANVINPLDAVKQPELKDVTAVPQAKLINPLTQSQANLVNPMAVQQADLSQALANPYVAALAGQTNSNIGQQQALVNALQAQGGVGNQASVMGQQQALANQLAAMARGEGPNPAMAQLANTTGQNVANQAALMAGQRGAGANAGLMARQIGQQGAAAQQQAAGQAAAMRAQQQLNAIGALQGQQGAMANLASQQVAQQQAGLGQLGNLTNAQQAAMIQAMLQNQGMQLQQQGLQQSAANALNQAALQKQGLGQSGAEAMNAAALQQQGLGQNAAQAQNAAMLQNANQQMGALGGYNSANIGNVANFNEANQQKYKTDLLHATQAINMVSDALSGPLKAFGMGAPGGAAGGGGGASAAGPLAMAALAEGGPVYANSSNQSASMKENYKGKSEFGRFMYAHGGKAPKDVPALVSPGEIYLSPDKAKKAKAGKIDPLKGEKIKGKPVVKGAVNSYANDTVPKTLKEGGIVLPRSVTQSKDPKAAAERFIAALKAKKGK
jgi:hypothetical protein